jgi:pyrophosphatase PpaX
MTRLALLFDLDGTLLDSIDLLVQCMTHTFAGRSHAPTREQWIAGIGTPLRQQLAEWADDDALVEELVSRYRDYQLLHFERLTSTFDGVHDLLQWAGSRGHALGVVTSKGAGMTTRSLEHVQLADAFDVVVTVEATPRHKPAPDPVLYALEQLGISANRALFVGDSPHDMLAGRAAGVMTVACRWGPFSPAQLEPATPTFWASRIEDVRAIIEQVEHSNLAGVPPVKTGDFDGDHARSHGDDTTT